MATIRKSGKNFTIIVSNGRDMNYKQILERTTFRPDPGWSERKTQQELQKFALEFEAKVKNGQLYKKSKMFFAEFVDKWFAEYVKTNLSINTQKNYGDVIKNHLLPRLGKYRMEDMTSFRLQSFLNSYYDNGKLVSYQSGTIQKIRTILCSIFNKAYQWQVIQENPMARVYLPRNSQAMQKVKFFTPEQAQRFLDYISTPYEYIVPEHTATLADNSVQHISEYTLSSCMSRQLQLFFILLLYGGFRRGEALALTWDDIDFESNEISINKSAAFHERKAIIKETKTKGSVRVVSMPEAVMEQLKIHRREQRETAAGLYDYWHENNLLFTQDNGVMMHPSTPYGAFKAAIQRYNESQPDENLHLPNIPLHGLRHTSATIMLANGANLSAVAARLGHSQTSTTLNVYAHAVKSADHESCNILDSVLTINKN